MRNRSIFPGLCHGVLVLGLCFALPLSLRAGGKNSGKPVAPTFEENVLSTRKGSMEVEWEWKKTNSTLSPTPNLYKISILSPARRQNVSLLVNEKPVINISPETQKFDFDFSNYGPGEIKVTLLVFDNVKAGSSTKTLEVLPTVNPVSGFEPPSKK